MSLRGQAGSDKGYAMAALLVAMAVMAILMSAALPVWRHEAQREKEEELVFRGQQYVRALRLYQARTQTLPPSVDMLVTGHFLRKKYKDPITNDDFELVGAANAAGAPGQAGGPQGRGGPPQSPQGSSFGGGTVAGGILGVRSKSKDESIRLYQGRNHYNEWTFIFVQQQPGRGGQPGGPGGPQRGRGNDGRGGTQGGPPRGGPPTGFPGPGGTGIGPGRGFQPPIGGPGGGRRGGGRQ